MSAIIVIALGISKDDFKNFINLDGTNALDFEIREKIVDFCIRTPDGLIPSDDNDFNMVSSDWIMNHSCNGYASFDKNGNFIAIRHILKDEELTYDYALVESNPNFQMKCICCETNCRKVITGNDWKDEEFFKSNSQYMLPYLRALGDKMF